MNIFSFSRFTFVSVLLQLVLLNHVTLGKTLIITDIDETIKQSHQTNFLTMTIAALTRSKDFKYLKEILKQMLESKSDEDAKLMYVSASFDCLTDHEQWLIENHFPEGKIYQRNCTNLFKLTGKEKLNHKFKSIIEIIKEEGLNNISTIYYFGDNSEIDPLVYLKLKRTYPSIKSEIYIRDIKTKATNIDAELRLEKLENIKYFFTEKELLNNQEFSFVSPDLKLEINKNFKEGKLHAPYAVEELALQYKHQLGLKSTDAKDRAEKAIIQYLQNN